MICKLTHLIEQPGIRIIETRDGRTKQQAHADFFTQAALDATPNPGDVAYFQATQNGIGDLVCGEQSTLDAFEAQ